IHVVRAVSGLVVDEYDFAPMGLADAAIVTVLGVTRQSGAGAIDAYQIFNYHLGSGGPDTGSAAEGTAWNASRDAFYEWGPSALAMGHGSVAASAHHATSPNPYNALVAAQNLADDAGNAGPLNDQVPGLQAALGDLAVNATGYAAWYSVLAADADAQAGVDRVRTWIAGRAPKKLLDDEIAAWAAWRTPAPSAATPLEKAVYDQSQAILRMAQVSEAGKSDGQILASIAPGKWNISWVRDMAYATVALARSGHYVEAKRALAFQMGATVGAYQSYVGSPYQISVVRYFGNGTEESDVNADGPNVEFDGFGLFLWALEEYVNASKDTATLQTWWPVVKDKIADVLVKLQEPTGLIAPDSSIWEVHWNGQQKHFAYTTITAARGLCAASHLAVAAGASGTTYDDAAKKAGAGIKDKLRAPDGAIAQATESLALGKGFLDAAAIEAVSLGLLDPKKHTAKATAHAITSGLVPPSGRGFMRNDAGGWYDSQEWIFVDLRMNRALELVGDTAGAQSGFDWNVGQASDNFGILSELHDRLTADYAGEAPMVGFGAGAYVLALASRGTAAPSDCIVVVEPDEPSDAGPDATPPQTDAGPQTDGGKVPLTPGDGGPGGCACDLGRGGAPSAPWMLVGLGVVVLVARRRRWLTLLPFLGLLACSDDPAQNVPVDGGGTDASADVAVDAPPENVDGGTCTTTFRYVPPSGSLPKTVALAGEWNAFASPGTAMTGPDGNGAWTAQIPLPIGLVGYKLLLDGVYALDPGATFRKYVNGVENSAVQVTDCYLPSLSLTTQSLTKGGYQASVAFVPGWAKTELDAATAKATLRKDFVDAPAKLTVAAKNAITIDLSGLADGKYSLFVEGKDRLGRAAAPLRLVFWVEGERFDWRDALMYMAMTDRFKNGDTGNDVTPVANVDVRANFQNGDLEGVRQVIASGALDQLGVRALWLTPFQTNTAQAYPASDGIHQVTGYHGYWPIKAREVDPRLGGEAALKKMVAEAHAHGIRVLMDYVVNHVHEQHEYFTQHPDWFRTGCVCGTNNCDWTVHRLDCLFATYLPDVNWSVPEVSAQYSADAIWWVDTFDLDGLRIDAVKHVEDAAIVNLSANLRGTFEASGTKLFLTGETAMGWSDCGLACNQDQYDTISRYIGPHGLDGQFDFVLYHAVPYRVFDYDEKGFVHADYWAQASGWMYPKGAVMTPYIGSHDTPRSVTFATYRGQDAGHAQSIAGNQWDNAAGPPSDAEPYARHRTALAWLLGQPGAPLLYYGDEYGQFGGADPNNRAQWRGDTALAGEEAATLAFVKKLGQARRDLPALRRGAYQHVYASEPVIVFARQDGANVALVALNRSSSAQPIVAPLPPTLGLADGTTLKDKLGGPDVVVTSGALTFTLGPRASAIYTP
ncbi:MAG TPA: alpha-amylase family glycosyl hydrolase, partial [Polyangiaceae bacterium]